VTVNNYYNRTAEILRHIEDLSRERIVA
jgi:hypothetical protein